MRPPASSTYFFAVGTEPCCFVAPVRLFSTLSFPLMLPNVQFLFFSYNYN